MRKLSTGRAARQAGFTLIELIIVIVIIGILAAVAIPKYTDLTGDANQAAAEGVAGTLGSASAVNYMLRSAGKGSTFATTSCSSTSQLIQGTWDTTFTIGGTDPTSGAAGACTVTKGTGGNAKTANFTVPYIA